MSVEDNDNLYVLQEESNDLDDSPKNFAAYSDEERADEENEISLYSDKGKSPWTCLFRIMFNPVEGWKTLRRNKISVETLQASCFYPLLAILAVSRFSEFFYSVNVSLSSLVAEAVIIFVAYFFGFFCIQLVMSWILPKDMNQKFDTPFGKQFLIISLSTLALFSIFTNILPMLWPILIFLPIWTLYLMFKGARFFKFSPNREMGFFVLAGAATIGIPLLLDWGLNLILPY